MFIDIFCFFYFYAHLNFVWLCWLINMLRWKKERERYFNSIQKNFADFKISFGIPHSVFGHCCCCFYHIQIKISFQKINENIKHIFSVIFQMKWITWHFRYDWHFSKKDGDFNFKVFSYVRNLREKTNTFFEYMCHKR